MGSRRLLAAQIASPSISSSRSRVSCLFVQHGRAALSRLLVLHLALQSSAQLDRRFGCALILPDGNFLGVALPQRSLSSERFAGGRTLVRTGDSAGHARYEY